MGPFMRQLAFGRGASLALPSMVLGVGALPLAREELRAARHPASRARLRSDAGERSVRAAALGLAPVPALDPLPLRPGGLTPRMRRLFHLLR